MINPQKVFKKILREWGHDILLQRRLSDDFVYDTEMQRYTTRSHLPKKFALATAQQELPEGVIVNSDLLYLVKSLSGIHKGYSPAFIGALPQAVGFLGF